MLKRSGGRSALVSVALLIGFAALAGVPLILTLVYAAEFDFWYVPLASWVVLLQSGLLLIVFVIVWRRSRTAFSPAAFAPVIEGEVPIVRGHRQLEQAEQICLLQKLFMRHAPQVTYIDVKLLPGGYGGSLSVLAELRTADQAALPRQVVVKLGARRDLADERGKFDRYVKLHLGRAAEFYAYAACEAQAGVAYLFAGLDQRSAIQNFHQFYQGRTAGEVTKLIDELFGCLSSAWYKRGRAETANVYDEYQLLLKKREEIYGHAEQLLDDPDPYRVNFTALPERLQPHLRPGFCPLADLPWYDPVAFLKTWSGRQLNAPVHRSIVHGDLHARNILIEIDPNGGQQVWFIDFSHTGNGLSEARTAEARREGRSLDPDHGHTLRDFTRLEADVKFVLTLLNDEADLKRAVIFEAALLKGGLSLTAAPPQEVLSDERFAKAWQAIEHIRRQASAYTSREDHRPYYVSLLNATLPIDYYHPGQFAGAASERLQKRYAFLAAGMLCSQL
jgi:hypothetical protein